MNTEVYSTPFSGKLAEDTGLELTLAKKELQPDGKIEPQDQVEFLRRALEDSVGEERIPVKYDMGTSANEFPDLYKVAVLASKVYYDPEDIMKVPPKDKMKAPPIPDGWELIATAKNWSTCNRYFGAVFMNPKQHQIVIAHRGTKPLTFGAVWTDAIGILFNGMPKQIESACTFSKKVALAAKAVENDLGLRFQFIFTGHSLGAWLAQVTTFTLKYLVIDESQFQKAKSMSESIHAHTVVFDSPGCRPMLLKMQDEFDLRHSGRSIDINQLDITTYLSAPNLVNTCKPHVGTLYRIKMDFSNMNAFQKYTLIYTLAVHAMERIVTALDPNNSGTLGKPVPIVDFPIVYLSKNIWMRIIRIITMPYYLVKSMFVRQSTPLPEADEWRGFFQWACHSNNYDPEVNMDDFINNVKKCHKYWPIRYQLEPVESTPRCGINVFTLKEQEFLKMYQTLKPFLHYRHRNIIFADVDESHREPLEDYFKEFEIKDDYITCAKFNLDRFIPFVKQLLHWHPAILKAIKGQMSTYGIAKVTYQNESTRFVDSWKKKSHLQFKENQLKNYWEKQVWQVIVKEVKEMRTITNKIYCNTENKSNCTVLTLEQLLYINDSFVGLHDYVMFEEMVSHVFLIECEQTDDELYGKARKMLESILDDLERKTQIRFIFVTIEGDKLSQFFQQKYAERLKDAFLTIGKEVEPNWDDLTPEAKKDLCECKFIVLNGENNISLSEFVSLPVEEIGKIIDCTTLSKLINEEIIVGKKHSRLHNVKPTSIVLYEEIQSKQLNWMLDHNDEGTMFLFTLSGNEAEDLLKKHVQIDTKKIQTRMSTTNGWNSESNEEKWRELCHNKHSKQLYWFEMTAEKIHCKQIYNPKFYIQRQFKIDFNSVMKSRGLFIISYSELDENKVREIKQSYKDFFVIVLTELEAQRYFKCFKKFVKSVYWIKADAANQNLEWHPSDDHHEFTDCVKQSYLDEESLANVKDQVVIIAGEPGMGKSTTLTRLAEHLKKYWVIMRSLRSCGQEFKYMKEHTITEDDAVTFLSKGMNDGLSSDFAKALLKCGLQGKTKKTLYLLFDGFDEIKDTELEKYFVKLIQFLQKECTCHIWITTRKNCREQLEKDLSTIAVNLIEFGCEEQKMLLAAIWGDKLTLQSDEIHPEHLSAYAQKILDKADEVLGPEKLSFLTSPLQLRMIAEAFCPNAEAIAKPDSNDVEVEINDKISLYQTFIKRKYDIYLEDKAGLTSNTFEKPRQWCAEYLAEKHENLAFRMLYPNEVIQHPCNYKKQDIMKDIKDMNHVGLIQSEYRDHEYDFIHGSIVDYFVAKRLARWLNKPDGGHQMLKKLLMSPITAEPRSKGVRSFIEEILKETPVNKDSSVELSLPPIKPMCRTTENPILENCCLILYVAAEEKLETVIKILFDCFKQHTEALVSLISWRNEDGKTALYAAMEKGNDAIVDQLVNLVQDCSTTAQKELLYATCYRTSEENKNHVISKLMEKLESSEMKQMSAAMKEQWPDITNYMNAAKHGDKGKISKLLPEVCKDGEAVYQKYLIAAVNKKRKTALHFSAMNGHEDIVIYLLQKGANVNAKDDLHNTPLHVAVENGHVKVKQCLMDNGADVNARNKSGKTPLEMENSPKFDKIVRQFCMERKPIMELLNQVGPDNIEEFKRHVNSYRDQNSRTPLHIASENGNAEAVKWLREERPRPDLNAKDDLELTPLHLAAENGYKDVVEALTKLGANLECKDKDGNTALHFAARTGKNDIVEHLLKIGANAYAKDNLQITPLHIAVEKGYVEVRGCLLNKMIHQFCKKRGTTMEITQDSGPAIEEFKKFVPSYKDKKNRTPLHIASMNGNADAVQWLSDEGLDLNVKNNQGQTPLHVAAKLNHKEVVKVLKISGASLDCKDKKGKTASQLTTDTEIQVLLNHEAVDIAKNEQLNQVANDTPPNQVNQTYENITVADDVHAEILAEVAESGLRNLYKWNLVKKMIKHGVNVKNLTADHKNDLLKHVTGNHKTEDNKFDLNGNSIGKVIALNNVDILEHMIDKMREQSKSGQAVNASKIYEIYVERPKVSETMWQRIQEAPFSAVSQSKDKLNISMNLI